MDHLPPLIVVAGDDPALRSAQLRRTLEGLAAAAARDEFDGDYAFSSVALTAATPDLFGGRRVVVARNAQAASGKPDELAAALADAGDDVTVVIEWAKAQLPAELAALVEDVRGVTHTANTPRTANDKGRFAADVFASATTQLSSAERRRITDHVGNNVARIADVVELLDSGSPLTLDEALALSGDPGEINPWALEDAIDARRPGDAIRALRRLLSGDRHPLGLVSLLTNRYRNAHLIAVGAPLPAKTPAPAKRAAEKAARRGAQAIEAALERLAEARGALTGGSALPDDLICEVLVARLATIR